MFKTQNIYQNDEKWSNTKLGDSSETIGGWGGLLTSITMMLNGIGYNETPETVNEKLKKAGGFLRALPIPSVLPYVWPNCVYQDMQRCESSHVPITQIDAAVAAGKPVILEVDSKEQKGIQTHFVLVKEKRGDDYVLYDPCKYDDDGPDKEVLLSARYKYNGAKLESEISAVLWFDFCSATLTEPRKVAKIPVPSDKYRLYVAEDNLVLRADPSFDGYPWKRMVAGTELVCLESKATVKTRLGVNSQWIRVQDPNGDQGYVAAKYVTSSLTLPSRKKWCLKKVAVENPRFETWDHDGTVMQDHKLVKSFNTLPRNTVVNVLRPNEIINGDSYSLVTYQETYYDSGVKNWVTTRVTGLVKDADLDDYHEHENEEFQKFVVDIPHATKKSTDAQQYMTIIDEGNDEFKARYNMCGELSVAFIVEKNIDTVLAEWKGNSPGIYNSMVGKGVDEPLGRSQMEDILKVQGIDFERYKDEMGNKISLAVAADPRCASEKWQEKLKTHYFITNLRIDTNTGDLIQAHSAEQRNHWVVVDKSTRNGSRVELYNPFPNKREEYTFGEFYKSVGGDPNTGWWIKREANPTFASEKENIADGRLKQGFETPKFAVMIDNPTPDLTDAEQYIKVEGLKKTNLCGEFSVSFILSQSMNKTLLNWMENQGGLKRQGQQPAGLRELTTLIHAYGLNNKKDDIKSFSIDRVLKFWKAIQPDLYNSILGGSNNLPTGPEDLITILNAYGYNKEDITYYGQSSPGRDEKKLETHFLIAGVKIDVNKKGTLTNKLGAGVDHWVVVDKMTLRGNLVGGNGGWVELYNPFLNRWEEYSYREFTDAFSWSGLWVKKEINPKFTEQRLASAKSKDKDSKKNTRVRGKKDNASKPAKPGLSQNEFVQKSLKRVKDGESAKSVARALAKQLNLGVADASKLIGISTDDDEPSLDIEKLMYERLQVDSVAREVGRWIREKSEEDTLLAEELTDALREFGVLIINEKKAILNLEVPALSDKLEDTFKMRIDKSIPASQLLQKVSSAIGSAFAYRAIEEIKIIQAKEEERAHAIIESAPPPKISLPQPAYRVMWDWERDDFKVKGLFRPNLPCVFRCGEIKDHNLGHYVPLTREWQFFWFDLCCKIVYGRYHQDLTKIEYHQLANKWTVVGGNTTAFTNKKGLDKFRNYVLKERLEKEDPKIYTLVCGGASLAGSLVPFVKGKKSKWMLKVNHFDGTRPPPPVETIDPYTDPRVFFANSITSKKIKGKYNVINFEEGSNLPNLKGKEYPDGGYSVNPFPQFDGKDVPVPLIAATDIYYPLTDLVSIDTGQKPSPYFP